MQRLLDRINVKAAKALEDGRVYRSVTAYRSLAFAVDALMTAVVDCDGYLTKVYDFLLQHNVYADILKEIGLQKFCDSLAMALVDIGIPVRVEYIGRQGQDPEVSDLESQWTSEPWTGEAGDNKDPT